MLDPRDAVDIPEQACRGLDYAHRKRRRAPHAGLCNLLRSHEGGGQAATSASPRRPRTPRSPRPAPCSAPPRTSRPSRPAARSGLPADLYALGVVSYQLLTGRLPYEAASTDPGGCRGPPRR